MEASSVPSGAAPRQGRRGLALIAALVVAALGAAAAVLFLVVLDDDGESATKRALSADLVTGFLQIEGNKVNATGTAVVTPGGRGAAVVTLFPQGDLRKGKPVPITGTVVLYLDEGTITSDVKGTATPLPKNAFAVKGTGTVKNGTGTFDGATGTFSFDGGQETGAIVGKPKIKGSITY